MKSSDSTNTVPNLAIEPIKERKKVANAIWPVDLFFIFNIIYGSFAIMFKIVFEEDITFQSSA